MALTHTRTHTVFFDEESLAPLREQAQQLIADFLKRKPYIDSEVAERFQWRVELLLTALHLLGEPAD